MGREGSVKQSMEEGNLRLPEGVKKTKRCDGAREQKSQPDTREGGWVTHGCIPVEMRNAMRHDRRTNKYSLVGHLQRSISKAGKFCHTLSLLHLKGMMLTLFSKKAEGRLTK